MEVLELVQYLNRKLGITIVMVLHDLNLAAKYSDYLYALKKKEESEKQRKAGTGLL